MSDHLFDHIVKEALNDKEAIMDLIQARPVLPRQAPVSSFLAAFSIEVAQIQLRKCGGAISHNNQWNRLLARMDQASGHKLRYFCRRVNGLLQPICALDKTFNFYYSAADIKWAL